MFNVLRSSIVAAMPGFAQRPLMIRRFKRGRGEAEIAELPKIIRPTDVAIDVGGNVGDYTYPLSRLAASVVTFEPNPALAKRLQALRLANVEVRQFALSASAGTATLTMPLWPEGHGFGTLRSDYLPKDTRFRTYRIEKRTLDSFSLARADFLKIDVEGLEEEVLDGAMATIGRSKPAILIELAERFNPGTCQRVRARLAAIGYDGHFLLERWRPMAEFDPARHQDLARMERMRHLPRRDWGYVNNFLFLPPGRTIG